MSIDRALDGVGRALDDRFHGARGVRVLLRKVFPDHWTFLLGEIALYSFIILLLTGTFLTLFFQPSMHPIVYHGSYRNLDGVRMSGVVGVVMFALALFEVLFGYSLPDDLLSGTGLRILEGVLLSIPVVGTYLTFFLFGGPYPAKTTFRGGPHYPGG